MSEHRFTINELADITGVSVSTIRNYRRLRAISPPLGQAHYTGNWTQQHVEQIRRIQRTKRQRVTLIDFAMELEDENDTKV